MYDFQELEAFVAVVRTGSLTASTRDLGLPKSTLSRKIRQLEERVGQPLLLRQSRKIVPNDAGRVFYRYCNDILELVAQGREALDELKAEVTGKLELRCHESFVRGWFSRVVESFMSDHEDIRVTIHTQRSLPETVEDGICIWLGQTGETGLRQEVLGVLEQGVYGSPEYFRKHGTPASPGELAHHSWADLLGEGDADIGLRHSRQGRYPLSLPDRRFTVDQLTVQGDAIAAGRGLGLMPIWLAERRLRAHPDSFQRCLPEWYGPALPVTLLYPHGILPRRVRAFIAHLRTCIPEGWAGNLTRPASAVPEIGTYLSST